MRHANIAIFIPHIGCPNMCSFCNQHTISGTLTAPDANKVKETLNNALHVTDKVILPDSEIAFFGGSFTAIDREYMISLLKTASEFVSDNMFSGIRVSTRPDAISPEILDILKKYKVTAIELGAQSMCDDVLRSNRRGHTSNDVRDASELIKKYGFSLGLQMMTGLYTDTNEGAVYTANEIIKLKPDTVRIYPTVVLKSTHLAELFESGKFIPDTIENTVELCAVLMDMFEQNKIKIIRVGLHDEKGVKENFVAGAYHPALGELIMGERMYNKALKVLENADFESKNIQIKVNPAMLSKMIGQKRKNIEKFAKSGYNVKVLSDRSISEKNIIIEQIIS